MGLLLGIDTGGTFTDAALIDAGTSTVIATAKALTTKGDLAVGVAEAMAAVLQVLPDGASPSAVELVSVSTTLATNAVVEGHGSTIAVVLIGFDADMVAATGIADAFPSAPIITVAGGHNHSGAQVNEFDGDGLAAAVGSLDVSAFAVASVFAVRNPSHEHAARDIIQRVTGRPVTVSTELTSSLDAPRRALTAVLNARLLSRITTLIDAVRLAMDGAQLSCPLMIVKGDGTVALASTVSARPIETVLSGPAASLVGAAWLAGLDNFVLADIGGTTTDLGVLTNGRPAVGGEGATVGGWRTMVQAIDITTIGLGGDSAVTVVGTPATIQLAASRVIPLSLLAHRHPSVTDLLRADLADVTRGGSLHGQFVTKPAGTDPLSRPEMTERERRVWDAVQTEPLPLRRLAGSLTDMRALDRLVARGVLQRSGFTPSDAAHVLGLQQTWSTEAAQLGATLLARFIDMRHPDDDRVRDICRTVWSETVRRSAVAVVQVAMGRTVEGDRVVESVCAGTPQMSLVTATLTPTVPVVAVGGPAPVFYPEVGRRLNSAIVFPPYGDVANAVGAATGVVARRVVVTIEADEAGFRVHSPTGIARYTNATEALAAATRAAGDTARTEAAAMGAADADVQIAVDAHHLPGGTDDHFLYSATITAEAVGRPRPG